jgi:DNA-binding NarL/FixJ family response regulator
MDSSHGTALQIKVFIASDVRLHREGLAALLRECPSIRVMGADNVLGTQNALRVTEVDVALIDALSPSDSDTIGALRKIRASGSSRRGYMTRWGWRI